MGTIEPINRYTMLTKKQLKLLQPFTKNIFKEMGQRELGRLANERSNNTVQLAFKQFEKENIITSQKIGTSKRYRLNIGNEKIYDYLTLLKYEGLPKTAIQSIEVLKEHIEKYTLFYSLIIFGSYASGEQHKKSDLDIVILLPDKSQEKNMAIAVNTAKLKSLLPLHVQTLVYDGFIEMLIANRENVGKEIARKHQAVHNINIFYKSIKKAINHGFNY